MNTERRIHPRLNFEGKAYLTYDGRCRCENVTFGAVRHAIGAGERTLAGIKRATRCGMGPCQGRYCSPLIAEMLTRDTGLKVEAETFFRAQAPLRPLEPLLGRHMIAAPAMSQVIEDSIRGNFERGLQRPPGATKDLEGLACPRTKSPYSNR